MSVDTISSTRDVSRALLTSMALLIAVLPNGINRSPSRVPWFVLLAVKAVTRARRLWVLLTNPKIGADSWGIFQYCFLNVY